MTDAHVGILRAKAKSQARRLAADDQPHGAVEGPSTKRRADLERRSAQARRQLSRAQAWRGPTRSS